CARAGFSPQARQRTVDPARASRAGRLVSPQIGDQGAPEVREGFERDVARADRDPCGGCDGGWVETRARADRQGPGWREAETLMPSAARGIYSRAMKAPFA